MRARRPLWRAVLITVAVTAALTLALHVGAAERPRVEVTDYTIDATVNPQAHKLAARAKVTFTALEDLSTATFELHNALRPTRVSDASGKTLAVERVTQDNTVRVALPDGMTKGQASALIFDYEGSLTSADDSPVQGLKLASIADPITYLLYAGRWFPVAGFGTDRFTATININVPQGYTVIGSGSAPAAAPVAPTTTGANGTTPDGESEIAVSGELPSFAMGFQASKPAQRNRPRAKAPAKTAPAKAAAPQAPAGPAKLPNSRTFTFNWQRASFPGTIIIGRFEHTPVSEGGSTVNVYFTASRKNLAREYGETASKELAYFTTLYGVPMSNTLNIVELPDDTVPSAWAPELVALSGRAIGSKLNYRLLANGVSRQWWGVSVSPASRNDFWITEGGARYSEARYVEQAAGRAALEEAVKDMSVGALAYESVPLSQIGTMDPFDPVFQSMATDKGGMVFHMLRWALGEQKYDQTMRTLFTQYAGKPVSMADLRRVSEQAQGDQMTWFFSQWLESTGAPEFQNKYTILRTNKGFRVVGEVAQDLDLFRMPVELRIDTDGQTETKRIDVVGTNSPYTIETFGKPRRITVDPNNWVLKNSPELKVRTAILRGQQLVAQGNLAESLREFQKSLDANKNSSLAHYRIAEVFYLQRNYQAAANAYRESLNGDGEPKWTEVWSHIQLGKIFDVTGQRERALNEYRQAIQTNDNTQGALEEARKYLQEPFKREETTANQ